MVISHPLSKHNQIQPENIVTTFAIVMDDIPAFPMTIAVTDDVGGFMSFG
jgi:hypothetical protein